MSRLTEAYGWRRSETPDAPRDAAAIWQRVGQWYVVAGGIAGTLILLVSIIAARASHSATAIGANILAAALQPIPMIALGLGIQRRQVWAQWTAVVFPLLILPAARALQLLPLPGPDDFLIPVVDHIIGEQTFQLPAAAILACVVVWQLAADRLDGTASIVAVKKDDRPPTAPSRWQKIGQWYLMAGAVIGAPLGLLAVVGTQAARSSAEMYLGFLSAALQLVPMMGLGLAIEREQRWARWAGIVFPLAIAVAQVVLRSYPAPHRGDAFGETYATAYYLVYDQRYYLPFALILAIVVVRAIVAERR